MTNRTKLLSATALLFYAAIGCPQSSAQTPPSPDPDKSTLDRLMALTHQPEPEWHVHADMPHPEDQSLDDSAWETVSVKNGAGEKGEEPEQQHWKGTHIFRRWIQIPEKINGYATQSSEVKLDLRFRSPGSPIVTVFSNSSMAYRGDDDNIQPLVLSGNAQPGQKFLVAIRIVAGDEEQFDFRRSDLIMEAPHNRPDPALLRMEILAAKPLIAAYEEGKSERQRQLSAAMQSINFAPLDKGDQSGFDASLKQAHAQLEVLKPWLQQFTIRAVGNSHIDMAWLWPWTETVEVVRNTFQSVLDLMREYPDFKFTMSSARTYEWMQEKYPDLFAQIQQRVKAGRWEIIGGMWVEPDLNMPAGESLVRQILVGKRYFQKNFGVDVKIGWNPDSFGYNWQLPQIYKKSGVDYFVTQKLLWAHEFTTFPYKLFWWQSPDGSRLLTYFPHDYAGGIDAESLGSDLSIWMPSIYGNRLTGTADMMHLYGVGDHGGGPTRTMLDHAQQLSAPNTVFPKLEFSFASSFFQDLEKKLSGMDVPTWNGELYFQYHRGVFTTQAETKRRIRRSEENLLNAEQFASIATLYGRPYPREEMELAWKHLLFDHFHDVMPGSGIAVNYLEAKRNLEDVNRAADEVARGSLHEIAAHINTQSEGVPVMIFNSLSWPRQEVVELEAQLPVPAAQIEVMDAAGKAAVSQLLSIDPETHRAHFLLLASIPAMGYKTYFVRTAAKAGLTHSPVKASIEILENEFIRLKIDPKSGCMTSLVDKRSNIESLAPAETDTGGPKNFTCGNLLQTFVDKPKQWDAWNIDADFEKQHWDLDHADEVKLLENGPLRAVIRITNHFQNSTFIRDVTLYAGVPRVDVKMQTEWHEKHILLKVAFPVSAHSDHATFEIPYGSVERPTTRNTPAERAQFEVPAQRWADISDDRHGFSLLNDCKYGYDAKGNVLRLSLLRSPEWPDPHADEGHHEFTYSLYPHAGTWREALTIRQGYELNYKPVSMQSEKHRGALTAEHSFLQTDSNNIVVTAVKTAQDDNSLIIRFYEWAGQEKDVRINLPSGAIAASETNLMEVPSGNVNLHDGSVLVHTKPYEIKSVKVQFSPRLRADRSSP
ncbi:MAG TPA: glycoside hydrolase family 38 C-terminal domain-containing protein [Candidatus Sulfotelmatobacter sp.]